MTWSLKKRLILCLVWLSGIAGLHADTNIFAPMPFNEGFATNVLQNCWTVTGTGLYHSVSTDANSPRTGSYHLTMDSLGNGSYARNETTLGVNLAGYTNVVLSFWAKGFSDEPNGPPSAPFSGGADFDGVAISQNGTTWYEVQSLRSLSTAYTQFTVNLDPVMSARGLAYTATFRIRFNQYDNFSIPTDGIAIDDISITGTLLRLKLNLPAQLSEGDGTVTNSVSIPAPRTTNVVVALNSSDTTELIVPSTVTIPSGQTNALFGVTVVDDLLIDGTRTANITATAAGYGSTTNAVSVVDNESQAMFVTAPATINEGDGILPTAGTLSLTNPPSEDVWVTLVSSDVTELVVPAQVKIPAGQLSVPFPITAVDDTQIDGTQNVVITPFVQNWQSNSVTVAVLDNESTNLALSIPSSASEGNGTLFAGKVSIAGTLTSNRVVNLSSSDTTEITVPLTATIFAGQTSAFFNVTIVDDGETDGTQTATVQASAPNFGTATSTIAIADNDAHHFVLFPISSPQSAGVPFNLTIGVRDINDVPVSNYYGTLTLEGVGASGPVSISLTNITIVGATWSNSLSVRTVTSNIVLSISDGLGHTNSSDPFDVVPGPLDHFVWSSLSPTQHIQIGFPVTITARDPAENILTNFAASVALAGFAVGGTNSPLSISPTNSDAFSSGSWTGAITVGQTHTNMFLRASDGAHYGNSSPFRVEYFGPLTVSLPVEVVEGNGVLTNAGVVRINSAPTNDVLVYLQANNSEIATPATVVISAGETNATFDITVIDDAKLDATQNSTVLASAAGYISTNATLSVRDNESAVLTLDVGNFNEASGVLPGAGTLRASVAPAVDIPVTLLSSDTTEIQVPSIVILPAGQTSAVFNLALQNDSEIDGDQMVTLTASFQNWTPAEKVITVFDNESKALWLTMPTYAAEGDGVLTNAGCVTLSGTLTTNLVITLQTSDASEISVPASVMIPAGQTSVFFDAVVVDDLERDGIQNVTISASSSGFLTGTFGLQIWDNDPQRFSVEISPTVVTNPTPVTLRITALDVNGAWAWGFRGPVTLTATGDYGAIELSTSVLSNFTGSISMTTLSVITVSSNITLSVSDAAGASGTSDLFHVVAPAIQSIPLSVGGLAYDPTTAKIFASIRSGNRSNTLTAIDAATGNIDFSIPVGSQPGRVAISDDGQFAYVVLGGTNGVQRVNLLSRNVDLQRPGGVYGSYDVEPLPGRPHSFAVSEWGLTAICDDAVQRTNIKSGPSLLEFADATTMYAFTPNGYGSADLGRFAVNDQGLTTVIWKYSGFTSYATDFKFYNDQLFLSDGQIWSTNITFMRQGPLTGTAVDIDPALGRAFYLANNVLGSVDMATYSDVETWTIPGVTGTTGNLEWCGPGRFGFSSTSNQLFIVRLSNVPADPEADLVLTQTDSADPVATNAIFTLSMTVTNAGRDIAHNVVLTNTLSTNVTFLSATVSQGTLSRTGAVVNFTLGTITNGRLATATVTVRALQPGVAINTARITATEADRWPGNNVASTITTLGFNTAADVVNTLRVPNRDMVYDPYSDRLFASIPSSAGGSLGNTIFPIDPKTGLSEKPIYVGGNPGAMGLSDNGQYLYVYLRDEYAICRVNIPARSVDLKFSAPVSVFDVEVFPGQAGSIAVVNDEVTVFDNGVARPKYSDWPPIRPSRIEISPDGKKLYGWNSGTTGADFSEMSVENGGLSLTRVTGDLLPTFSRDIRYQDGLIFSTAGYVVDPTNHVRVKSFVGTDGYLASGSVCSESSRDRVYFMSDQLRVFEPNSCLPVANLTFSGASSGTWTRLLRWGNDGLAFHDDYQITIFRSSQIPNGPPAELALTMTVSPVDVGAQSNFNYILTIANNGTNAASNVKVIDRLPTGMTFVAATNSQGTTSVSNGVVTCNLGVVNPNTNASVILTVRYPSQAALSNVAAVVSSALEPDYSNNVARVVHQIAGTPLLAISTVNRFDFSGTNGGPFDPTYGLYCAVTNRGTATMTWSVGSPASWLKFSTTGGTLAPGAVTGVTLTVHTNANALASGSYSNLVSFRNVSNGAGDIDVPVALTITPVAVLSVSPATNFNSSGVFGGPFSPGNQVYFLTNVGDAELSFTIDNTAPWLDLSVSSGALLPGENIAVVASVNATANTLDRGDYAGLLTFINTTSGRGSANRMVSLAINKAPLAIADHVSFIVGPTNISFNVLSNDFDFEGDPITLISNSSPGQGILSYEGNGNFAYSPSAAFTNGIDQFVYKIGDNHGGITFGKVTIRVFSDFLDGGDWTTFGNGPAHTGYYPALIGTNLFTPDWNVALGAAVQQVAVADGRVLVSTNVFSGTNYFIALNANTGEQLWSYRLTNGHITQPTYREGRVYVQRSSYTSGSGLYCLNETNGASIWTTGVSTRQEGQFAPLVTTNGLWVGCDYYGGMTGFTTNGQWRFSVSLPEFDAWTPSYYENTVYSWVQGVLRAHNPIAGNTIWSVDLGGYWYPPRMNTLAVFDEGYAFVFVVNGGLHAIDLTTRKKIWSDLNNFQPTVDFANTPAVANGVVYATVGDQVRACRAVNGEFLGSYRATNDTGLFWQPIITDDSLLVSSSSNTYVFNLQTRQLQQTIPYGGYLSLASGRLYVAGLDRQLRTFELVIPATIRSTISGNQIQFTWRSSPGRRYRIQFKTNLDDAVWTTFADVTATSATTIINDSLVAQQRFYQVITLP